jgi:hypothetical protein
LPAPFDEDAAWWLLMNINDYVNAGPHDAETLSLSIRDAVTSVD